MPKDHAARMYEDLRRLWLSTADPASREEAEREFDAFCKGLVERGVQLGATNPQAKVVGLKVGDAPVEEQEADDEEEISQTRMLMEIILEVDTAMRMVPPRVKTYRDLLAAEGLDKTSDVQGEDGQKGLAGINLADQAALEFHRALLGLAITIAQAEAYEKVNKKDGQ